MSCLLMTEEIKKIAKSFPQETDESIKNLISLWQESGKGSIESYPTVGELSDFMTKLRGRKEDPITALPISKYVNVNGNNKGFLTEKGEELLSTSFDKEKFNEGTTKVSMYPGVNGTEIRIDFTSPTTGNSAFAIYHGSPTRKIWDLFNSNGSNVTNINNDRYWNSINKIVPESIRDLVESGKYSEMDSTAVKTDSETLMVKRTALEDYFEKEYNVLKQGRSTEYNTAQIKKAVPFKLTRTPKILKHKGNWYRAEAIQNPNILYVFTDNTDRDSGSGIISDDSWYSKKYGKGHHFPTMTAAVVRGLDNARPISTQRWYHQGAKGTTGRWTDADINEFKSVIRKELQEIVNEFGSGKYNTIMFPDGDGLFNTRISNITKERTPKLYQALGELLHEFGLDNLIPSDIALTTSKGEQSSKKEEIEYKLALPIEKQETANTSALKSLEKAAAPSYDYNTPTITTNSNDLRQVAMDYDPIKRRDRANLIAKLFSNEIDTSLQEVSEYVNKKLGDPEVENKEELISKLNDLDRISVLNLYTPAGIFNRVLDTFKKYVNDSMENNIAAELDTINSKKGSEKYSDEKKLEAAKKIAAYKNSEYEKLIRNFRALADEAGSILSITEGIVVDSDDMASSDVDMTESDTDATKVNADELSKEESVKDGWMTNFREISSKESLSKKVREVISNIPKLNSRGKIEKDDLGFPRYLDADYVHAALIDSLKDMIDSSDMIPTLNKLSTNKVWVKQLIKTVQGDNTLFSKFYQDFRKDFMPYWIQIKNLNPDGTYNIQTKPVNKPEGIYYLINSWRDNYEGNVMLDKDSVYTLQGFDTSNADKGLAILSGINSKFNNLSNKDKAELAGKDESIFNDLLKALHMVGVDANPDLLKQVIGTYIGTDKVDITPSVVTLVNSLNVIFSDIAKNKVSTSDNNKNDLINLFSNSYSNIANILAEVTEDAIESSSRENGKSYYSHVTPSYLGKLIKNLKNVYNNKERFEQFINTEFKQYNWFFKNNSWRNDWLNQLVNSPKMREGLNRKVLLNSDKVEYTKWDDLDYSLILFNEYNSEPTNSKSDTKWAWYYVPILSDSPSAEFIRFRKYTNGDMYNEDGEPMSYQEILTTKFIDLVGQEYDRIMLVRARDNAYQAGNKSVKPITNFDIVRDDNGEIINIGGAEFKFLPQLNSVELHGESFLDTIARLREDGDGATMKSYISAVIQDIMESSFEDAYKEWYDNGVFEETEDGKFKNLTFRDSIIKNNSNQAKLLREIKQLVTSESSESWSENMESLLQQYVNNSPINDNFASSVLDDIYELEYPDEKSAEKLENLKSRLSLKNTAKEAFREYFWNSSFATSQIIQLTTTDLAFYKEEVDFQKRYKEIYAPSLRLNTDATFNGEKVGRKIERTIYLKDETIISSALDDINEILKEHNVPDREEIIKKFKEVNVADAQAYRSLDSYRAIKVMSGDWNDDMEKAYHNFKNNTWDASDFDTIWQTIKPFVFTQVSNNSGIDTFGNIKTPVQHKNSEFLLLAMYNSVSGPLGKSGKLRAINSFMEQNNIDVVQFESAVKVGKQRRININSTIDNSVKEKLDNDLKEGTITQEEYNKQIDSYNVDSFDKTLEILNNATGIAAGNEDPNVVHAISYEDYGIQTATPEHAIDAKQLLGTQIKKLITADIPEGAIISVNGKNFSKAEFLSLYNSIITENMLESYYSVKEELLDPKEISNILIETVKSNKKYNYDMIKACTLDDNGDFTIPLFDPVQSVKTQQMINSIIKSRIVKQKLKGGALIQVSDYGLSKDLHIVFTGKGKNKRIKYLECYMPAYSRKFYEPLMDPETHQLDVSKLPEDLRKLIGYRV